ncbi:ABC transporter permease [Lacisediminihabitans profunda]|uniref:ABC transporter permease n=1 Tax=Lacisediminihabitans profunda TaxID=2594790 RepID=A0A5C8UKD4_9MICO|nr:ABC transporter permease [Lacisediminihabitans profunda]TXN28758.1 ABC transporter permease [Lacisediminihabitans profunda]
MTTTTPKPKRSSVFSSFLLPILALVLIIVFSIALPRTFPTAATAQSILNSTAVIAILALAEMLVVIVGEFDLSVGYVVGLQTILLIGFITTDHIPWPLAVLLVLIIGALIGLVNGVLVYYAKIDSFIATLGTGTLAYAAANWYTQGAQLFGTLPQGFINIYGTRILGIPIAAIYVVVLAAILWFVLGYTPTGRYLYALGSNRRAAELTGISSKRVILGVFVAAGLIVAVAGVVLASSLRIGSVSTGPDYLLPVFVGAILGSTTIKPGRPNAWGTVVAVVLLGIGIAGLEQIGASYFVEPLFNGATLIIGVGLAGYASRRTRRVRRQLVDAEPTQAQPPPLPAVSSPEKH